MFRTWILVTSMAFLLSSGAVSEAGSQPVNPTGELQPLSPDNIWAQTLTGSHFNEFWTYHFFLDDGLKVHITFSAANFGSLKSPVTGVRVSVFGFDDKTYQLAREYPIEHLVQDKDEYLFKLRPGRDVWFKGKLPETHEVRVVTSKDGVKYDIHLNLSDIAEGKKIGDGIYFIGDEKIGLFTHIPYAKVNGIVKINEKRRDVSGTAYMDHTFQNQTTTRLMDSGYRFISHTDRDNWDILYFMLPADARQKMTIGHHLSSRDGNPDAMMVNKIQDKSEKRTFNKRFAHSMDLMLIHPEGRLNVVNLQRKSDDERFSILSDLSWAARRAARTFLGGEVLEFRGEAVFNGPENEELHGFYNFFVVD